MTAPAPTNAYCPILTPQTMVQFAPSVARQSRIAILIFAINQRAWIMHIGKDHARATKYAFFQMHVVVHRHIILNLAMVTDSYSITNVHILTMRLLCRLPLQSRHAQSAKHDCPLNRGALINNSSVMKLVIHKLKPHPSPKIGWRAVAFLHMGVLRIMGRSNRSSVFFNSVSASYQNILVALRVKICEAPRELSSSPSILMLR